MNKQYEEKIHELKNKNIDDFSQNEMMLWQYFICCTYFDDPLDADANCAKS